MLYHNARCSVYWFAGSVLYANNTQNQNNKIRGMEAQGSTIHTQNFRKRNKKRERNRNREKEVAEREREYRERKHINNLHPSTHACSYFYILLGASSLIFDLAYTCPILSSHLHPPRVSFLDHHCSWHGAISIFKLTVNICLKQSSSTVKFQKLRFWIWIVHN